MYGAYGMALLLSNEISYFMPIHLCEVLILVVIRYDHDGSAQSSYNLIFVYNYIILFAEVSSYVFFKDNSAINLALSKKNMGRIMTTITKLIMFLIIK